MSLYSLPCLQEVDGITVLWGVRDAAGLFPCEGMTVHPIAKVTVKVVIQNQVPQGRVNIKAALKTKVLENLVKVQN